MDQVSTSLSIKRIDSDTGGGGLSLDEGSIALHNLETSSGCLRESLIVNAGGVWCDTPVIIGRYDPY